MNLDDPVAVALRVAALLERAETPYALYGGLAVAAYGDQQMPAGRTSAARGLC